MTRNEALDDSYGYVHMEDIDSIQEFVNKIYDDFESRTCENCKHSKYESETFSSFSDGDIDRLRCWNNIIDTTSGRCVNKDFGCNKWEGK